MGAQASKEQMDKIVSYLELGPKEGAETLIGGGVNKLEGLENGFYIEPTVFKGTNDMKIFQDEIFGPVMSVTTFKDFDDAIRIANDTIYGLGAGVWSRNQNTIYRAGRAIQAGRVWVNQYHSYPAHAAFGGYKQSGIGRENHLMMLNHYQQTKNLLVSYDENGDRPVLAPFHFSAPPLLRTLCAKRRGPLSSFPDKRKEFPREYHPFCRRGTCRLPYRFGSCRSTGAGLRDQVRRREQPVHHHLYG